MRNMVESSFQDLAVEAAHPVDQLLEMEVQGIQLIANVPMVRQVAMEANERYAGIPRDTVPKEHSPDVKMWADGHFPYQEVLSNDVARFLIETKEMAADTIMGILVADRYGAVVAATSQTKRFMHAQESWWKGVQEIVGGLFIYQLHQRYCGGFACRS